jgi:uncharacterized protein YyaL (SSP411 family)
MARYPTAFGHALGATDLAVRGAVEVAISGDANDARFTALARVVSETYVPSLVLAGGVATDGVAVLASRNAGEPMAYLCRNYSCDAPTNDPGALREQLRAVTCTRAPHRSPS